MKSPRRDHLVGTAMALFERRGFHATGIDTILAESGVAKMTLYKHFRSKEDLIVAALRARGEEFRSWFAAQLDGCARAPRKRLGAFFEVLESWITGPDFHGCPFILAAGEFPDPLHPVHLAAAEHKLAMQEMLRDLCAAAGVKNPKRTARQLHLLAEGAMVAAQVGDKRNFAKHARSAADSLIKAAL